MSIPANYSFGEVPHGLIDFVKDKRQASKMHYRYLLARTTKMFQYNGLPDTIPASVFERQLQVNGVACITEGPDGELYSFGGSVGGKQDAYYRPTRFIIANPHLGSGDGFTKEAVVLGDEEHTGVLMRNDTEWFGLSPLIGLYASLLTENFLTIRSADVMLRVIALLSAPTDRVLKSAQDYLKKLEKGEFGVIGDSAFTEGINMQSPPSNNGSYLTQFIELHQYLKGSFFGEIGLRANYNMKREAIGLGESALDEDAILPLCDNMLMCRQQDLEEVNRLFGTSISVEYSSAWLQNHIEYAISLDSQLTQNGAAQGPVESGQVEESRVDMGQEEGDDDNGSNKSDDQSGQDAHDDAGNAGGAEEIEEGNREDKGESAGNVGCNEPNEGDSGNNGRLDDADEGMKEEESENINDIHGNELLDIMKETVDEMVSEQLTERKEGDDDEQVDEASTEDEDTLTDD